MLELDGSTESAGPSDVKRAVRLAWPIEEGERTDSVSLRNKMKQLWRLTAEGRFECAYRGFVLEVEGGARVALKAGICACLPDSAKMDAQTWKLTDNGELCFVGGRLSFVARLENRLLLNHWVGRSWDSSDLGCHDKDLVSRDLGKIPANATHRFGT